jgi:hypothetical protein
MRLPASLTAGTTAAAALLLLTACGGDGDSEDSGQAASSAAAASSSAADDGRGGGGGGGEDVQAFCAEAESVFSGLDESFEDVTDPAELPGLLQQATSALQGIDPPAEIEAPWSVFSDALARMAESAQGIDLSTTEGQDRFTQEYSSLMSGTADAQQDVDEFVTANCPGVGGGSAGPTG